RHGVPGVRQEEAEALPQAGFVIDHENAFHRRRLTAMGKNSLNAAPPSRAASTHTTPPISCTDRATIARPSPVPRPGSLVVKKGSKTFSRSSGATPDPESATKINAPGCPAANSIREGRRSTTRGNIE